MKGKNPHFKHRDDAFIRIMKRKRKRKKQAIVRIVIAILILIVSFFLYGSKKHTAVAFDYDTCLNLWDLAERHCPENVDKREFIEEVVKLNSMSGYTVYSGQVYQYPIY